jgi:mono/diheme cytochrome c family protein
MSSARGLLVWPFIALLVSTGARAQSKAVDSDGPASFDVMQGDQLAHTFCINCHAVDAKGPAIRTDRAPSFSWIAHQEGLTPATLPAWLSTAHERMPDFSLTRDEIRQVSAYILSQRK